MPDFVSLIAQALGIPPANVLLILGVVVVIANLVGKSIPASSTGWLGIVRKIALTVGLYIPQRLTPNVTTQTVTAAIAAEVPDSTIKVGASQLKESVATGVATGVVSSAINEIAKDRNLP